MSKSERTPKKIAGLKLPKEIREQPAIRALLSTKEGRKLLGDALIEGAAAAAAKVVASHETGNSKTAKSPKAPRAASPRTRKSPARVKAPALASAPEKSPADTPASLETETPPTAKPGIEVLGKPNGDRPRKSGAAD